MRYLLACILTLSLATPALAAFDGPGTTQPGSRAPMQQGGFQGPQTGGLTTVTAASRAPEDSYARLEGRIVEKLGGTDDKYMFEDSTGKMMVDIDRKLFAGRTVTPDTKVRLHGEIDHKRGGTVELDVDVLEIL